MNIFPHKKSNVNLITLTVTFSIVPLKCKAKQNVVLIVINPHHL